MSWLPTTLDEQGIVFVVHDLALVAGCNGNRQPPVINQARDFARAGDPPGTGAERNLSFECPAHAYIDRIEAIAGRFVFQVREAALVLKDGFIVSSFALFLDGVD